MHGQPETSNLPRFFVSGVHLVIVGAAAFLLVGPRLPAVDAFLGVGVGGPVMGRAWLLVGCAMVYLARAGVGMHVFLRRRFDWTEAGIVLGLFGWLHTTFSVLGVRSTAELGWLDGVAVALYGLGSFLNTGAEFQRHRFKSDDSNQGRLFTGGLFRGSMHINYFGDTLLFTGFALLTGSLWALSVPGLMTAGFVFQHVPQLDRYLAGRYGAEFEAWAGRTARFVPFVF